MQLLGKNGYNIAYNESIPENANTIIVAMHGFCGDKESSCISALEKRALGLNIGLIKFDWAGHGESEATGEQLTIDNCMADIDSIIEHVKESHPEAKLVAFSTSFGGYLTLLYLRNHETVFNQVILRSPAIHMYDVLKANILTKEEQAQIEEYGSTEFGFERKLKITNDFVADLKNHNVDKLYGGVSLPNVSIIHGTVDDLVPYADSESFAREHGCKLHPVVGADHRYKKEGEIDKVIEIAIDAIMN